ncbi:MAG: endonuclease/exonuclease/phosphatase family protein [Bacteroidales bacterium]|nr:endonuclease/exonuclease/phosphatase family protein [Bacteroidales bacterium]
MSEFKKPLFTFITFLLISMSGLSQTTALMTYNIRYDNTWDTENNWQNRKTGVIKLINDYKPTILGIQEGLYNQVKYIDSCLVDYKYIGVGRDGLKKGEYSALFYDTTKYKLIVSSTFWLSETPELISIGWDAALKRICTYGLFENQITKERMWIFNTHFDHIGEVARENSAQLILDKIHQLNTQDYPVVLMGDFNLSPNEKPILELSQQLEDAQLISIEKNRGPAGTFNGFTAVSDKKIDYFFTKKLVVLSYQHLNDKLKSGKPISDHLAVLISVKPERQNKK